jgi:hypothetical protein
MRDSKRGSKRLCCGKKCEQPTNNGIVDLIYHITNKDASPSKGTLLRDLAPQRVSNYSC